MEKAELKTYAAMPPTDESGLEPNSSYAQILALVDKPKSVVDFGCGPGNLDRFLSRRGCSIIGVDINPEHAIMAREYCEDVLVADLDAVSLFDLFPAQRFDVAIFADILEHLRDPARVLAEATKLLRPGGIIIASIPNVAHGAVRLALLDGDFDYQTLGVLDDTHVRFFTRKSMEVFFERAGLVIDHVSRTIVPIFEPTGTLVPAVDPETVPEVVLNKLRSDPDSETLQFVVRAVPAAQAPRGATKRRIASLERHVQELQQRLKSAEAELAQKLDVPTQSHLASVLERLHVTTLEMQEAREAAVSAAQAQRDAEQRADDAMQNRDEVAREADKYRQQHSLLATELQQLAGALEITGAEHAKLEALLANANESVDFERRRGEQRDTEIARLQSILQHQVEQVNALSLQRDDLVRRYGELSDEARTLKDQVADLCRQQTAMREKCSELEDAAASASTSANNGLMLEMQQLVAALEIAGAERAKFETLLESANEALDVERRRGEQREKQAAHLQTILQHQVEQVNALTVERDALAVQQKSAQERIRQLVSDNSELHNKTEGEFQVLRAQIREAALRAEQAEFYLDAMRKSKFWLARNTWFRVKRAFGITTDIP